jgi:hypothetical protein
MSCAAAEPKDLRVTPSDDAAMSRNASPTHPPMNRACSSVSTIVPDVVSDSLSGQLGHYRCKRLVLDGAVTIHHEDRGLVVWVERQQQFVSRMHTTSAPGRGE